MAEVQLPEFSAASTRDLLGFGLEHVVQRKRLVEIIARALDACAGQPIRDRYLADVLAQSLEGAVVQLCSAAEWTQDLLRQIRGGRLKDFRRAKKKDSLPPEVVNSFDTLFPNAVTRNSDRPNADDVLRLEEQLRICLAPLRVHRDKILAHWDANPPPPATWGNLVEPFLVLEQLLGRLWHVHAREPYKVQTLSPHTRESTSEILAKAIQRQL